MIDRTIGIRQGKIVSMTTTTRPGPRERLLSAGRELTYEHGVNVGVDAILKRADVARRSLYQHFGGKDELIAEVLRTTAQADERRYEEALAKGGDDPRKRLLALFDTIATLTSAPTFHGCRYTAATLTLADQGHPAHAAVRTHKEHVHELLQAELEALGHPRPPQGADQLLLLIDGALAAGANRPDAPPGPAVRALAERVLDT